MELVNRHHQEQKLLAAHVIAELHPLWNLLDFHNLESSTPDWLRAVRPVIERGYLTSQYVAAEFAKNYRASVLPDATPLDFHLPSPVGLLGASAIPDRNTQLKIMVAMRVTGPIHVANLMPMDETDAMYAGFSKSAGAATRLVLNGGRGMIRLLADADARAKGVVGIADENACKTCMGQTVPAYKTGPVERMDAVAVGHDFCKCSARLVY